MNNNMRRERGARSVISAVFVTVFVAFCADAFGHGERNQEPFLRMRTVEFYDMTWSTKSLNVNDYIVIAGKFRLFGDWPNNLPQPDKVFLGNGTPGPVLVRTESYIDGVPAIQSSKLLIDRDYAFKTVLKGRIPGMHHVHPMLNVLGAGPLLGPGNWLEIKGNAEDFRLPVKTIDGTTIDNLETWGLGTVYTWHAIWLVIALVFLLWWLRKPLLITRFAALNEGYEDELVTRGDRLWGAAFFVGAILLVFAGYQWAQAKYPHTIPLQAGEAKVAPLPEDNRAVSVAVERATYDVPGRSMKLSLDVTNSGPVPVAMGEMLIANLRWVNKDLPAAVAAVDPNYPKDLLPPSGLKIDDARPIAPGETRKVHIDLTDAAWEVERLTSLMNDPDNRIGGLIFFYDGDGKRNIADVSGPILPVFTHVLGT
jgi:methane/ammonia monooxygenase subunit B